MAVKTLPLVTAGWIAAFAASPSIAGDFSGPHVDAIAGWGHSVTGISVANTRRDGFVYGGGGGYDFRSGNIVLGALGEISDSTRKGCGEFRAANVASGANTPIQGTACGSDGRTIFGGLRLGYVLPGDRLLYVVGGYANLRQRGSFVGTDGAAQQRYSVRADRDGMRIGAGVEQRLTGHALVKAEYRYTAVADNLGRGQHQLALGVGYRF